MQHYKIIDMIKKLGEIIYHSSNVISDADLECLNVIGIRTPEDRELHMIFFIDRGKASTLPESQHRYLSMYDNFHESKVWTKKIHDLEEYLNIDFLTLISYIFTVENLKSENGSDIRTCIEITTLLAQAPSVE